MAIYESRGFTSVLFHNKDSILPFDYLANFKAIQVPKDVSIDDFKRTSAPYCIMGLVRKDKLGQYKRSNDSLINRDMIFLDYDSILINAEDFKKAVHKALADYSYILFQTIKSTPEKPRYRLCVVPDKPMDEPSYKETLKLIGDLIGIQYDTASETWSQLQGLPVTTGAVENYDRVVNRGGVFPTIQRGSNPKPKIKLYPKNLSNSKSMTMRVIDTLLNGLGNEGGRNVNLTKFVGLLLNKWVDCDIPTAYDLALIANDQTDEPLPIEELDKTFESIVRAENRKRA